MTTMKNTRLNCSARLRVELNRGLRLTTANETKGCGEEHLGRRTEMTGVRRQKTERVARDGSGPIRKKEE